MKVIFLGTPQFAVPALDAIYQSQHQLVAVVAQPDKLGSRNKIVYGEVKQWAMAHSVDLYQFSKISTPEGIEMLTKYQPDIIVTAAYGQMLSQAVIDVAKHGIINIHGSLLPHLRGASPIQHSIISGDKVTGITILKTVLAMDAGDMIAQRSIDILPEETFGSLYTRLSLLGGEMIVGVLDSIENGTAQYTPQDDSAATFCRKITAEQENINWNDSATNICNLIAGLNPTPVAWTTIGGKRVKIFKARVNDSITGQAGTVVACNKKNLTITCGEGSVDIVQLQPENGKVMDIVSYLCGRHHQVGTKVGNNE